MAAPEYLARHNYSDAEIFQAIKNKLEEEKFDFSSAKAKSFDASFGKSVRCDIRTSSDKHGKNRGWYHIKPNINRETGEYWPTLIYRRIAGDGEVEKQKWSFSEFYLDNKDSRPKQSAVKLTPEQIEESKKRIVDQHMRDIEEKKEEMLRERDISILSEIELNRTVTAHQVPGQRKKVFLNMHPYIGMKMFNGSHGVQMLNPEPFTEKDVEAHLKKYHTDLADEKNMAVTVERVMKAQSRSITREQDIDDPDDNSTYQSKSHRTFANLAIKVVDVHNNVRNMQLINAYHKMDNQNGQHGFKSIKSFLKDGPTTGVFEIINTSGNRQNDHFDATKSTYILSEGWASGVSSDLLMKHAFSKTSASTQTLSCLTKSNIAEVALEILKVNPQAKFLIGYDNDASSFLEKKGINAGLEQAIRDFAPFGKLDDPNFSPEELQKKIRTIIPPIGQHEKGISDWDDLLKKHSQISVKVEGNNYRPDYYKLDNIDGAAEIFKQSILDAAIRREENVNEFDYLKSYYEDQRSSFYKDMISGNLEEFKKLDTQQKAEAIDAVMQQVKGSNPYPNSFSEYIDERVVDQLEQAKSSRTAGLAFENFKYVSGLIDSPPVSNLNYASVPFGEKLDISAPEVTVDELNSIRNGSGSHTNDASMNSKVEYVYDEKNDFDYGFENVSPSSSPIQAVNAMELLKVISAEDVRKVTPKNIFVINSESLTHIETEESIRNPSISNVDELVTLKSDNLKNLIPVPAPTPPTNSNEGSLENTTKAKTYLFTSYWLYNLELERARNLVGASIKENITSAELAANIKRLSDNEELQVNNGLTMGGEVILMASDEATRKDVLNDLKTLVSKRPEWENMNKLVNIVNDHVLEIKNSDRQSMLLNNKAITTIFANSGNSNISNPEVLNTVKDALDSTSKLNIDRESRIERYFELRNALMVLPDQEPKWIKEATDLCDKYVDNADKRYSTKPEFYNEVVKSIQSSELSNTNVDSASYNSP